MSFVRIAASIAMATLPLALAAQDTPKKEDPSKLQVEVTGCVRGSTLVETSLAAASVPDEQPSRRWRLRGPKAVMRQLKEHEGKVLKIVGTMKNPELMATAGRRVGKTNIFIGGDASKTQRDPLPELPTVDVEAFDPTGEKCR